MSEIRAPHPPPTPPPPPQPGLVERFLSGASDVTRGVSEATGFSDIAKLPENIREIVGALPKQLPQTGFTAEGISVAPDIETLERDQIPPHRPTTPSFLQEFGQRTAAEATAGAKDIPAGGQAVISPTSTVAERLMGVLQTTFALPRILFSPLTAATEQAYDAAFQALPESVKYATVTLPVLGETSVQDISNTIGKPLAVNLAFIALGKMQLRSADIAKTTAMRETLKKQGLIEAPAEAGPLPLPRQPGPAEASARAIEEGLTQAELLRQTPGGAALLREQLGKQEAAGRLADILRIPPKDVTGAPALRPGGEPLPRPVEVPITETQRTLESVRRFEEGAAVVREAAERAREVQGRIRTVEQAGLPVPKMLRREQEPPQATIPPKPTGIPPELQDVVSGQARAFLKPPAAEGTVPTAGEQAIRGVDLKQWAKENAVGYYKSRSGAEVVFDPGQLTQSKIKQLDKAGKLEEIVNGPGTAPKPAIPTTAVTARTPEGTEVRTVLTETPEQTRAAVEAQPTTTKVEVAPAAQAAPKIIQERIQYQPGIVAEAQGVVGEVPTATPAPKPQPTSWASRIDKRAPSALKSRAAKVDELDLVDFQAGGKFDYLKQLTLTPKNEKNRVTANLMMYFETAGEGTGKPNPKAVNKGGDFGVFQFSPDVMKEISLGKSDTVKQHLDRLEKKWIPTLEKRIGSDDPKALALGHLNQKWTKQAVEKAKPTLIAGGGPSGAGVIAEAEGGRMGGPLVEPHMTTRTFKELANRSAEYMREQGVQFDPAKGRPLYQLMENIAQGHGEVGHFITYLEQKGVKNAAQTLAEAFGPEKGREAGRTLQIIKQIVDEIGQKGEAATPKEKEFLGFARRWDNMRRVAQTGQIATGVRNTVSQAGYMTMDAMADVAGNQMYRVLKGQLPNNEQTLFAPLARLGRLATSPKEVKRVTGILLERFPKQQELMYGSGAGELEILPGVGEVGPLKWAPEVVTRAGEKAVRWATTLNKTAEFAERRVAFVTKMEEVAHAKGLKGDINTIPASSFTKAEIEQGVRHALDMTAALAPEHGSRGEAFIRLVNAVPFLGTGPIPYPRYLTNYFRQLYEYSPVNKEGLSTIFKMLSAKERSAIASGDTKALAKAVIGGGLLYTGYQMRMSEFAGERPWEFIVGKDETTGKDIVLDTRPYNPFVPYLVVGDFFARMKKGTLNEAQAKDYIMGTMGGGFRAGAGLYLLDNTAELIKEFSTGVMGGEGVKPSLQRAGKEYIGQLASGYTVPFRVMKDTIAAFDDMENKARATKQDPLTGPAKANIPFVSQTLPEGKRPTQAETPQSSYAPLARQYLGASFNLKSDIQKELDARGFSYRDILPSQGHPEADQAVSAAMGPLVEAVLPGLIRSQAYKQWRPDERKAALTEHLHTIREVARQQAEQNFRPEVLAELYLRSLPPHLRALEQRSPEWKALIEGIRQKQEKSQQ